MRKTSRLRTTFIMGFLTCSNLIKTIIQFLAIWSHFCACPASPTSQQSESPNLSKLYTITKCSTDDHCEYQFYCYASTKVCAPCFVQICLKYGRQLPRPNYCAKSQVECGPCLPEYTDINGSCESKNTVNSYKVIMDSSSSNDNTTAKDSSDESPGQGGSFTRLGWILIALTIALLIGGCVALFVRLYRRRMMLHQSLPTVHYVKSDDCNGPENDADLLGCPPPYNPEMDRQWFPGSEYQYNYPASPVANVDSCVSLIPAEPFQSYISNPSTIANICQIENISLRISDEVEESNTTTAIPFTNGNFPTRSPSQSNSIQAIMSALLENFDDAMNTDTAASTSTLPVTDVHGTDTPGEMVPAPEGQLLGNVDQVAPQMEDITPVDSNSSTGNIVDDNHTINEEFLEEEVGVELLQDILNIEPPILQIEEDIEFLEEQTTASPNPHLPLLEISFNLSLEVWPIPNWYRVDNPIANVSEPVVSTDGSDNQVNYVSLLNLEGPQGMNIRSDDETGLDRVVPSGDTQPLPMDNMDPSFYGDQLP